MVNSVDVLILGARNSEVRKAALTAAGYACIAESSLSDPLADVRQHSPSVVLVGAGDDAGLAAIRNMKSDADTVRLPVAAVDIGDAPQALRNCLDAGADDVFEDDTDDAVLVARMRPLLRLSGMEAELLRRSATARQFNTTVRTSISRTVEGIDGKTLVVGAAKGELETLCPLLPKSRIDFTAEPDPYRARHRIEGSEEEAFDGALIYVRDEEMREKCEYFCRSVRNDRRLYDLPLFLVTDPKAFPDRISAYQEGANVVAEAPVDCDFVEVHLNLLLRARERRRALGRRIAATLTPNTADELGTVYSEEFTRAHLDLLSGDRSEHGAVSSAILFFVPTIGEIAALYGMEDAAMLRQQLASWLAGLVRIEDLVGRNGPDEFLALLPSSGLAEAEMVRRRVVGVLHQSEFRLTDNVPTAIEVYVQSGITEIREGDGLDDIVSRAGGLLE